MAQGGTCVRKREGTGCSMSGVRIFLRTYMYIRVAASETSMVMWLNFRLLAP